MISIVVPVYNVAVYLDECILSIISQEYNNWECILVDDGSTDESGFICERWAKKDNRIKVIHQQNAGVSSARNKGLVSCKGDYICFVDSDDSVGSNYLKDMIMQMEDETIDLVSTGTTHVFPNGKIKEYKSVEDIKLRLESAYTRTFIDMIGLFYGPYSKLYKANVIREHKIKFPENCSLGEDLIFNFEYLKYVNVISCLSVSNYNYKIIEGSLSNKYRENLFDILYSQWKIQRSFLIEKRMWNTYSQKFFYVKLWGIIHTSVFAHNNSISKIKSVLSIDEIKEIKKYRRYFKSSEWMKELIILRLYYIIYICNKFIK